jgi:hypothetical protein
MSRPTIGNLIPGAELHRGAPLTGPGSVRQIEVPAVARAHSTLTRIDYEDAFLTETGALGDLTPEAWARVAFEDAPTGMRATLRSGWSSLGLVLDSGRSGRSVVGWAVRCSTPDHVLLGARSRIGMPGELLFMRYDDALLFSTFVQQDNARARAAWAAVEPVHGPTVRYVLEQACRRAAAGRSTRSSRHT